MAPDAGHIERAENLQIVYFDQTRAALDPSLTLRRALAPEGDIVIYRGRPIHIASWAKRFLFRTDQLEMPVQRLSGGEQARILIARLMLQPADVLILDEPTNDLDIPTLEVLEESLCEFPGGLVLVTHDRFLLDRVSTSLSPLMGRARRLYADYAQWEAARNNTR
jgi:ATP-binding cassette subfamily F protein uup